MAIAIDVTVEAGDWPARIDAGLSPVRRRGCGRETWAGRRQAELSILLTDNGDAKAERAMARQG
jgi:hypothetical protein